MLIPLNTGLNCINRHYYTLGRCQINRSVKQIVDISVIYGDVIKHRNYCHKVNIYLRHINAFEFYLQTTDTKTWRLKTFEIVFGEPTIQSAYLRKVHLYVYAVRKLYLTLAFDRYLVAYGAF